MFSTGSVGKLNPDLPPMVRDISALGIFDKSRQSKGVCVYIASNKTPWGSCHERKSDGH